MAPLAQGDLAAAIDADVLGVQRVWIRNLVRDRAGDGQPDTTVVAWVEASGRAEVAAWLAAPGAEDARRDVRFDVRTDWIFFPAAPEAILIGVVEGAEGAGGNEIQPFRFNLRFGADTYRRHLEALARTGLLGLTAEPLLLGPERQIESPCVFVPIQVRPLRTFLRELPPLPVV